MPDLYSNNGAFTPLNGTMFVTTYGWASGRLTYIYLLGVLTAIWAVTCAAAVYGQKQHPSSGTFDPSDPVHLMMASSAGGLQFARFDEENEQLQLAHAAQTQGPRMQFTVIS